VLVIRYVDAGNTSHPSFSNRLSSLLLLFLPGSAEIMTISSARGQKAQHFSDIVTRNQPPV
jgi:hypothetical protein